MNKKILTAILLTALTVGQAWGDNVHVAGFGDNTWYNYKADSFGGGDGTAENPYLVSTPEQLALLAYNVNEGGQKYAGKYFSITANLSLDKTVGSKVVWVPIGCTYSNSFQGTVNGNGHIVSGMTITATSTSYANYFGLFGTIDNGRISSLAVKDASITLTANDWADVGGLVGECGDELTDCHAVANITCTNTGSEEISVGGLTGSCTVNNVNRCSSSGSINATGSNIIMGGLIGYAQTISTTKTAAMTWCCTSTSLKGGTTVGGLIGQFVIGTRKTNISSCFSCSFIDASSASYAGGVFGDITEKNQLEAAYASISCEFCGTMVKPSYSTNYGIAFGHTTLPSNANFDYYNNHSYTYDNWLCDLPTNGMGYDLANKVSAVTTPLPANGGSYTIPSTAKEETTFKDIFVLCSLPTYVSNDAKHFFPPKDVTTSFTMGYENAIGQQVTYALTENSNNVEVMGNTLIPLDPGEALLTIRCNGLERKALIKVNYGTEWDGQTATGFDGGNGSFLDPYLIRTVGQLRLAISNTTNYNKEGMYFKLTNDLFINKHLLQTNEEPRSDAHQWTTANFAANLDGDGHTIYGLYVKDDDCASESAHGLFATLTGKVSRLAVVDSYVWAGGTANEICAGTICGVLTGDDGALEQCVTHGRVLSDGIAGGMVGTVDDQNNALTDCFSCVHVGWATSNENYVGAGLVSDKETNDGRPVVTRCISTGKVEYDYNDSYGLVRRGTVDTNSCFDLTMMANNFTVMDGDFSSKPANMISGQMLAKAVNWKTESHRYPMLKLFADTPYCDLLSMPVLFAEGDRAGNVTQVFDFPNEGVTWLAYNGSTYIDVINSCGAASPVSSTENNTEYLIAQTYEAKSQSTKALRVMAIDVNVNGMVGLTFEDSNAEAACLAAFDADHNGKVTLREAVEATAGQFAIFKENAANVQTFRELRYFVGLTTLSSGMISGLSNLTALELPKTMTTIQDDVFNGCTALESVTLPVAATTASGRSFCGSGIKNIYVEPKNTTLVSRNGLLFNSKDELLAYPPGRGDTSTMVSGALDAILANAFYQVPGLTSIYLDNALPEGSMADLAEDGIVSASGNIDIYINDGSYNGALYADYLDDATWEDYEDHLHRYYPLTVTSAGWATLYIGFATQLPSELKAYIVTESSVDNNVATLKRVNNLLPATTPVVIQCEQAGTYILTPYDGTVDPLNKWENYLIGSSIGQEGQFGVPVNQGDANEGSILTLGRNSQGEVGFFYYQGTQIPPYRSYLTYNSVQDIAARFMLHIDDNEASGIEEIVNRESVNREYYDLQGRRLDNIPSRGIYIIGGKKVIIK